MLPAINLLMMTQEVNDRVQSKAPITNLAVQGARTIRSKTKLIMERRATPYGSMIILLIRKHPSSRKPYYNKSLKSLKANTDLSAIM